MLSEDEIAAFCVMLHYEAQLPLDRLKIRISPLAQDVTALSVWFSLLFWVGFACASVWPPGQPQSCGLGQTDPLLHESFDKPPLLLAL